MNAPAHTSQVVEQLNEWFSSFPADAVRSRIAELETEINTLAGEIRFLSDKLEEWERFKHATLAAANGEPLPSREKPDRKTAILRILGENPLREWKLSALYEEMIGRGWIERGEDSYHALQVYVSKLGNKGEVERPRKGFYRYKLPATQGLVRGTRQGDEQ